VKRARLDRLVCDRGLVDSRQKAQGLIVAGRVLVNDQPVTKAGTQVATDADIRIKAAVSSSRRLWTPTRFLPRA
jgi:23S rRNA (cytidine1920-2'-O)/16S rRNA (cytidine1409-2'-O)-methyltransferase